jgi:hypothetical protein
MRAGADVARRARGRLPAPGASRSLGGAASQLRTLRRFAVSAASRGVFASTAASLGLAREAPLKFYLEKVVWPSREAGPCRRPVLVFRCPRVAERYEVSRQKRAHVAAALVDEGRAVGLWLC